MSTPGGWNIIGRTPKITFDLQAGKNKILAGDQIEFSRISGADFESLEQKVDGLKDENGEAVFEVMGQPTFMTLQSTQARLKGHEVIPSGGVLSPFGAMKANGLVQNEPNALVLEFGLSGTVLKCLKSVICSIGGAACEVQIDGIFVDTKSCFEVKPGQMLQLGNLTGGNWAYLAIEQGFEAMDWCGSKGTLLGLHGAACKKGDLLFQGSASLTPTVLTVKKDLNKQTLEIFPGPDVDLLPKDVVNAFWSSRFQCTGQISRIGYRLQGSKPLNHTVRNLEPMVTGPGIIQLPPSGDPIVLMADAPRTGGYPRIGIMSSESMEILTQKQRVEVFDFSFNPK